MMYRVLYNLHIESLNRLILNYNPTDRVAYSTRKPIFYT